MYAIYLDTSGEFSSIKLLKNGFVIDTLCSKVSNDHSKSLLILIEELLQKNGIKLNEIDAIAVMNGPGSYTGLRISLATAKGFCYAYNIRLILLNKLDLMYHSVIEREGIYVALIPARQDEYFVSAYNEIGLNTLEPILMYGHDLFEFLTQNQASLILESSLPEFNQFKTVETEISDGAIEFLISRALEQKLEADIMLSEPFYLKNVFINKINKL